MDGGFRRIRVHLAPYSTFVIEAEAGTITACTSSEFEWVVGRDERELARELREEGAGFVDLINDRRTVRPARGYRAKIDL